MDKSMRKPVSKNGQVSPVQEYEALRNELNQSKKYVLSLVLALHC